jgi:gluconolactonase
LGYQRQNAVYPRGDRAGEGILSIRPTLIGGAIGGACLLAGVLLAAEPPVARGIPGVVMAGTPVELVGEGFEGTEGPLPLADGSLLFTENRAGRIRRIAPDGTSSVFLESTNGSNSLALAPNGDLISVQTADPAVGILYPAAHARRLADGYAGERFARPNDLVVDSAGGIFFTDPGGGMRAGPAPRPAIYYLSPTGVLSRLVSDVRLPNGIQLSPDEKTLYVADTAGEWVMAWDVAGGRLHNRRAFAKLTPAPGVAPGDSAGADGLAVDARGRLYVASAAGVQVFSPDGAAIGIIELPRQPQNLAFAGPDKGWLYVVGRGAVYRIRMLARGFGGRAK